MTVGDMIKTISAPIFVALLLLVVVFLLGGCGGAEGRVERRLERASHEVRILLVVRPNGQPPVECALWDGVRAGAMDCNWEAVNR